MRGGKQGWGKERRGEERKREETRVEVKGIFCYFLLTLRSVGARQIPHLLRALAALTENPDQLSAPISGVS